MSNPFSPLSAAPRRERRKHRGAARAGLIAGSAIATLLAGVHPAAAKPVAGRYRIYPAVSPRTRYRLTAAPAPVTRNGVVGFGSAANLAAPSTSGPWVAMAPTASGRGAWLVDAAGTVTTVGDAPALGNTNHPAGTTVAALVPAAAGTGYWMVSADGHIASFGTADYHGSMPTLAPGERVVGLAASPDGGGYWLATSSGRVTAYGNAPNLAPSAEPAPTSPVVAITPTATGRGYWMVTVGGQVITTGDAAGHGSVTSAAAGDHVVGLAATPDGRGYWVATAAGAVFNLGDAPALGNMAGSAHAPVIAITSQHAGNSFWLTTASTPATEVVTWSAPRQRQSGTVTRFSGAPGGAFACIRARESGGNYATNTGNGYYGAYQFSLSTWRSVGGQGLPSQASPAEQNARAQMLQQRSGWRQWSTAGACGA